MVLALAENFTVSFLPEAVSVVVQHVITSVGRCPVQCLIVVCFFSCGRRVVKRGDFVLVGEALFQVKSVAKFL